MKRFLICTMFCGEPDMEYHLKALEEQGDVEIEHRVFENMSEIDAHNAVYAAFNAGEPDQIRGKVDADVVLNPCALEKLEVSRHAWVDPLTNDYFTDSNIHAGLAFYGSGVRFSVQTDGLKCDRNIASVRAPTSYGVMRRHCHYAN